MALVVVQMGHVPRTKGATGAAGEQAFTRSAGEAAKKALEAAGHQVRLIAADVADAQYRGDAFVAIHADGSTNPDRSGASVGYQTPEGRQFAEAWKRHYVANGWTRGWEGDNYTSNLAAYYGVREAKGQGNRRAIIVEAGFLTNAGDVTLIDATRMANAITGAACELLGGTAAATPPTAPVQVAAEKPPVPMAPGGTGWWKANHPMIGQGAGMNSDGGNPTVAHAQGLAGGLVVDGRFGPKSEKRFKEIQRAHGLDDDGIVGPLTWAVLHPQHGEGDEGGAVWEIQHEVGAIVDNDFGPNTRAAVEAYQEAHGCTRDGIVGPQTYGAMGR